MRVGSALFSTFSDPVLPRRADEREKSGFPAGTNVIIAGEVPDQEPAAQFFHGGDPKDGLPSSP